ncbi:MAG: hypothetical protein LBH16_10290 [Treponema sp.]|nr:hypothetical protein [Treponema sp.]
MNLIKNFRKQRLFLLFLPLFISPLYSEPLADQEPAHFEEPVQIDAPLPDRQSPPDEESSLAEDAVPDDNDPSIIFEAPSLVYEVDPVTESRSFNDVFPNLPRNIKRTVMSPSGLRHSFEKDGSPLVNPAADSGIDLYNSYILKKNPSHVIEALILLPYKNGELEMLDIYNALGRIGKIKDQSILIRDNEINFFKDSTRLESARRRRPIPDPDPADTLPVSETNYLRFTDLYAGDFFLRGDIYVSLYGITYSMTNFRDVNFSIFRIMKAERFSAAIYLEPVKEGVLIYSMAGLYLPGFIVSRMNLTPNINVRITVLINWITEGLRIQESIKEKPVIPFR